MQLRNVVATVVAIEAVLLRGMSQRVLDDATSNPNTEPDSDPMLIA